MAQDSETDRSSKTLEPTEKKLNDARKKGDTPTSKEVGNLMVVVGLALIGAFTLPAIGSAFVEVFTQMFDMSGRIRIGTQSSGLAQLAGVLEHFAFIIISTLAPVFLMLIGGALVGIALRGETVIAFDRIKPKASNISPLSGLKRLFSADSLVEFTKSLVKVLIIGAIAIWATAQAVSDMWAAPGFIPEALPSYLSEAAVRLLLVVAAFLVPLAIFDIFWKRFDWRRKNRMSHKELRDEMKELEGSPEIKMRRAQLRRQRAVQRMATAVPMATVVLTNPTRLAIALKYEHGSDSAPICVAKGADDMARRIREIAHANDVPMMENKPLTRSLYEVIEVDRSVPVEHWAIMAEIIGFVIDLKNHRKGKLPTGSMLVTDLT
jgi:flagellar biosynthetic protein FlhB